jgi:hypothetical protein
MSVYDLFWEVVILCTMDALIYPFIPTEVFFPRIQLRVLVKFLNFFYDVEGCIILFVSKILSMPLWFYCVYCQKFTVE